MNLATRIPNDLWNAIRNSYEKENYQAAILDSFFLLTELIRQKSGSTADGPRLIGEAFSPNNPKIKITKLETESDKNIQKGYADILRGLYESIRNPRAHGAINDTRENSENIIIFIGYLYNVLSESKPFYSVEDFAQRVFDDNFHESERYAELLVSEIPTGKIFETTVFLYRNKSFYIDESNISKYIGNFTFIFNSLLSGLDEDKYLEISHIISRELLESNNNINISIIISIINDRLWQNIQEVSKLRLKYMIKKAIREAYINHHEENDTYFIAIFCTGLFTYLSKEESNEIIEILENHINRNFKAYENYYIYYIIPHIHLLTKRVPDALSRILVQRLKNRDFNLLSFINDHLKINKDFWTYQLAKAHKELEEDDIPF